MNKKIARCLTIYVGDAEELEDFHVISNWNLLEFQNRFDVDPIADPEMLDRYAVGPDDVSFLQDFISKDMNFDFASKAYFIEAIIDDIALLC